MNIRGIVGVITVCAGLALNAFSEQAKPQKPQASNPTGPGYRLGSEDVIEFKVYKEPDLTTTATVRPDGMISLPLAGEIKAEGKTTPELETEITSKLREFLEDPVVSVVAKEINSPKISVSGEVRKPDVFPIKQRMTVLQAIALAGGLTPFAKHDRVMVLRIGPSGQERFKLNYDSLIKAGEPFYLQPADTVVVE
jgi:polysaccharide export outer membrane protein